MILESTILKYAKKDILMITPKKLFLALAILTMAACSTSKGSGTRLDVREKQLVNITQVYRGKTYPLTLKWDSILGAFIVNSKTNAGKPWSGRETDDILFQNMVRAAFRDQVCTEGLHPGVLQFGYGYAKDLGWVARVKCTSKRQPDA